MNTDRTTPVAVVTGGSRGIGRAIVERLARDGYRTLLTYRERNESAADVVDAVEKAGGQAVAVQADLARRDDVVAIFEACDDAFGRLDALVLNAAVVPRAPLVELPEDDFDLAFAVNTTSAFIAFREAARRLTEGGRIVTVSTGLTRNPMADSNAYSASKAALEALTRSFAQEMGPRGITVNVLVPGITDTEGLTLPAPVVEALVAQTPLRRLGRPDDLAAVAAFLVSDDARWITGQAIYASGGLA